MRSAHPGPSWPSLNVQSHPLLPPRMWVYSPKLWHIQIMKRTAHNKGWTMWAYSIYCKAECKMLIKVYQWKRDHLDCKWHCPGSPYPWTCLSWPVPTYGAWAKKNFFVQLTQEVRLPSYASINCQSQNFYNQTLQHQLQLFRHLLNNII